MKNPFRSEGEAFRFVIATLVAFVLIAIGAVINVWLGVAVFVVETVVAAYWFFFRAEPAEPSTPTAPAERHEHAGQRRVLVVANETLLGRSLRECIRQKTAGYEPCVHVVTPALNSPLKHWVSDEDGARSDAQQRLESSLGRLRENGVEATGEIGDSDPLLAIEDALHTFGPDEVIISTHPEGRSHWLERGIVESARERFAVPVTHVVVDLEREREEVQ